MTSTLIPAARFVRVSGNSQDERSQAADCDTVAEREGLIFTMPDFQLHAISGSKGDKRHLAALETALAAIRSGEIQAVVVAHSSRLTRRDPDEADLFALQVRMAGGRIYSHDEPAYGSGDLMGRFQALMAHEKNHEYSKDLSDHVTRKFRNEIDAGGFFRGNPPAGYVVAGEKYAKHLEPDPHRAETIATAFADTITGTSTTELGRRLGMTADAIGKMLRNRVYSTGRYQVHRADGVIAEHKCEPLVHPDVQAAAIAALEARRTGDNVTSRRIAKDDFSGAVFCACGGRQYRYYGGGKPKADGTPSPRVRRYRCESCGKSVRAADADEAIGSLMANRTSWWLDRQLIPGDTNDAELERVRAELREVGARGLPDEEEDRERARLRSERKRLEALPSTPARWEKGFKRDSSGVVQTEGDRWASLSGSGRRAYLASGEFQVRATAAAGRTGAVSVALVFPPE